MRRDAFKALVEAQNNLEFFVKLFLLDFYSCRRKMPRTCKPNAHTLGFNRNLIKLEIGRSLQTLLELAHTVIAPTRMRADPDVARENNSRKLDMVEYAREKRE